MEQSVEINRLIEISRKGVCEDRLSEQQMAMKYDIRFAVGVADDLRNLRAYDRSRILDEIDKQLTHQPGIPTRRRKLLVGLEPPWEHVPPVWELRIGDWRVYYDIDAESAQVFVRAIREKPPHHTTEQTI